MHSKKLIASLQAIITIACLALNGCGGEPWTYQTDRELKPGPGIFSGEDGEFSLIRPSAKEEAIEGQVKNNNQ
ncbi:MAG: hypothetical protein ACN4GW_17695 [Desulforhopalus sp.]